MDNIAIKLNGVFLDLPDDFKLRIRMRGPLFKRDYIPRSYTFPFDIPATQKNLQAMGFRNRLDIRARRFSDNVELYLMGNLYGFGIMYVRRYRSGKFDTDILIDLGTLDDKVENKTLKDVNYGDAINLGETPDDVVATAKDYVINASVDKKVTFPSVRNIGFYKGKNDYFGKFVNNYVRFIDEGTLGQLDYRKMLDGDTIEINYYLEEEDEHKTITLTARDSPDLTKDEISSGLDPEVPGTETFPSYYSFTKWIQHIQIQLISNKVFNKYFRVEGISNYFTFQLNFNAIEIIANETSDKVRITGGIITSINWKDEVNVFDELYHNSVLNYYRIDVFPRDRTPTLFAARTGRYHTLCPFPYLSFIYKSIFETLELPFQNDFALDSEIDSLIMYQNFALDELQSNGYNGYKKIFEIRQIVPDIDLRDFLLAINQMFCLIIYKNRTTGKYYLKALKDVVKDTRRKDWNKYCKNKKDPGKEYLFEDGIRLTMNYDSADDLTDTRQLGFDERELKESVNDVQDLPIIGNVANEIRLVEGVQKYYQVQEDLTTWLYYSDNFYDYKVGDEKININTDASTMHMSVHESDKGDFEWLIPESDQPGSSNEFGIGINNYGLKLLFFRGMYKTSDDYDYPLASSDIFDYAGNTIANYRLIWDSPEGLFNVWWRDWYNVLNDSEKTQTYFNIEFSELLNFDFTEKVTFNDQTFYVDEIEFIIEMNKGITQQKQILYRS